MVICAEPITGSIWNAENQNAEIEILKEKLLYVLR